MIRAAIVGANGYTGFELMRLLSGHKNCTLTVAASRSMAGQEIASLYPSLGFFYGDKRFDDIDTDAIARQADVVFTALPHAASAEMGGKFYDKGVKVIDLSADFRYDDTALFESTYKVTHPRPDLNKKAVYGLCELNADKIRKAAIVGNPGCYTTSAILPLYPLLHENIISEKGIVIDSKSGATGAGRKADAEYNLCESEGNFKAYSIGTHRHTTEIEEKLGAAGKSVTVSFTPHLLPVKRGILSTVYATLGGGKTASDAATAYEKFYAGKKFVRVLSGGATPQIKWVAGSNVCAIGFVTDERTGRIVIVSCIDNLIKGASGQAIQNMNIMFGMDEDEGLPVLGQYL